MAAKSKKLPGRESNPGPLRDRQRYYHYTTEDAGVVRKHLAFANLPLANAAI
jgi:hypothetical protein